MAVEFIPESVFQGTYEDAHLGAAHLFVALQYEADHAGEPVDFAGELGLDVGGYDGVYRSVIGGLGLRRVVTIEPDTVPLEKGIAAGIVPPDDAFAGTLEAWVKAGNPPAQSTFIFNIMPRLTGERDFVRAVGAATAPGGIVAVKYREPPSAQRFSATVRATPEAGLRMLYDPANWPPVRRPDQPHNHIVHLYRRAPE